jgi:hypothetical protein
VVAFNTADGWSRDVSEEIANQLADLIAIDRRDVPTWLEKFIDERVGSRPSSYRFHFEVRPTSSPKA